jgi:hypothetical protein
MGRRFHIDKQELKAIRKLVRANVRKVELEITDAEVEFFKKHPHELEILTDTGVIKRVYLVIAFAIGFILVCLSIILQSNRIYDLDGLFNGLFVNLLFECGVALWGAAITVYLLEIVMERQEILNDRYKRIIQDRIKEPDK